MKKIIALAVILFMSLSIMPNHAFAAEPNLIKNMQIKLKSNENPARVLVYFDLTEPIDLSQGKSNIIFEYLTKDANGNLESLNYKKDRSWSGYLNSYDNYPSGERKYSSGAENEAYSDNVPATTIYTSTKTTASIDVTLVAAIRVTVLRADGSGEKATIFSDGTTSAVEKIEIPIAYVNKNTEIRLESTTAQLPVDTILIANELTSGSIYEKVDAVLANVQNFIAFEIKLESDGKEILPDGKVKISIPIPENFDDSRLEVYRIDNDGSKTPYPVAVETKQGIKYATFQTDHFSIYALAEVVKKEVEIIENPKTGMPQTIYYLTAIAIISIIGIVTLRKKTKIN